MLDTVFLICFVLLGTVGLASWTSVIRKKKRGQDLLGRLGQRDLIGSPYGLIDVFLVFFAWFGGQFFAVGVAMLLMGISVAEISELAGDQEAKVLGIVGLAQLVGVALALVALYYRYCRVGGGSLQAIGLQPQNIVKDVTLGGVAFAMVIPIVLLIQWLLTLLVDYEHASLQMLNKDAATLTFVLVWFVAGVVAPICEEIFFRGTLQAWLQRLGHGRMKSDEILIGGWDRQDKTPNVTEILNVTEGSDRGESQSPETTAAVNRNDSNPYQSPQTPSEHNGPGPPSWVTKSHWPIYVTAAIFAGLHIGQGLAPIPLFVLAVALGYLYRKTGSILPCIVLHMLLNMFSLFWYTMGVMYGAEPMP